MVDDNYGMPDPIWRKSGEWSGCEPNPYAEELVVGQAVRVNYRNRVTFAGQPIGHIDEFRVINGMVHAYVRWGNGLPRAVPRWALVKA